VGGIAVSYVFLMALPKLASMQVVLEATTTNLPFVEYFYHHAYLVALLGFVAYYLVSVMTESAGGSVPWG
jgi:hypothetical protein